MRVGSQLAKRLLGRSSQTPGGFLFVGHTGPICKQVQEVTGGVTNYVARLPEPANTVDEWKASLDSPALAQAMALSLSH